MPDSSPPVPSTTPPAGPPGAAVRQEVKVRADDVVRLFHQIYYDTGRTGHGTWTQTYWMGVPTEKIPLDLWLYQELMHALRPQLVIETGTRHGGSALFLSHMLDLIGGAGEVLTVDVTRPPDAPQHPRLTYLTGSSTDPEIVRQVRGRAGGRAPVLLILDSDHSERHVLAEMRAYHDLVTPGSYMIVEDTNVNGHPVRPEHGPGPMEAVAAFLRENQDFEIDRRCEKFLLTANPSGFLRRRDRA